MKIVAVIPSLNEEDNISYITSIIDRGLVKHYSQSPSIILNIDSKSDDKTVKKFLETPTKTPKKSIVNKSEPRGKGSNIIKAFQCFKNADYILTLDADLTSAKEIWIKKIIEPLLAKEADLVIPIYTRNRYEGNTTNHFSSPIIYACFNRHISQPIAGDFGIRGRLADDITKNIHAISDKMYGIDSVITWTALAKNCQIYQVNLDKKIHKPSFPKIEPMFEQVSFTTFSLVNINRKQIVKNLKEKDKNIEKSKNIDKKFIRKPSNEKINNIRVIAQKRLIQYKPPAFVNYNICARKDEYIESNEWVMILSEYLYYILRQKLTNKQIEKMSKTIVGLYLLRVLGYFREIENMNANESEEILYTQKYALRRSLKNKFLFE